MLDFSGNDITFRKVWRDNNAIFKKKMCVLLHNHVVSLTVIVKQL